MDPDTQQPDSSQPDTSSPAAPQAVEPSPTTDAPPPETPPASDPAPAPTSSPAPIETTPEPAVAPDDSTSPEPDPAPTEIAPEASSPAPVTSTSETTPPISIDPIHLGGSVAEMKILTRRAAAARIRKSGEHKEWIMDKVRRDGRIDSVTVRLALRVSESSARRYFTALIEEGRLRHHREGNNVVYEGV